MHWKFQFTRNFNVSEILIHCKLSYVANFDNFDVMEIPIYQNSYTTKILIHCDCKTSEVLKVRYSDMLKISIHWNSDVSGFQ